MIICKADKKHIKIVTDITHNTIETVYPHYYSAGAVDFFLKHHNKDEIMNDIISGYVYLLISDNSDTVGTVTIKGNEINRLFVLPCYQRMGFGRSLLDFAEKIIFENFDKIIISASLPAKSMYLKRGYTETSFNTIAVENGDFLCYDEMKKYKTTKEY